MSSRRCADALWAARRPALRSSGAARRPLPGRHGKAVHGARVQGRPAQGPVRDPRRCRSSPWSPAASPSTRSTRPNRRRTTPRTNKISLVVAVATIPAREPVKAADVDRPRGPARPDQRERRHHRREPRHRPHRRRHDPPGPAGHDQHAGVRDRGRAVLDPHPRRELRPRHRGPWRAISITVSDDLAVGGMLTVGESVDVFVTTVVAVPNDPTGKYMSDRSTKVTYQDMTILARKDQFYIMRAPVDDRRGDRAPAGDRRRDVQPRAPAARGPAPGRRDGAGRDDDQDHPEVRPADPAGDRARVPARAHATPTPSAERRSDRERRPVASAGRPTSGPPRTLRRTLRLPRPLTPVRRRNRGRVPAATRTK